MENVSESSGSLGEEKSSEKLLAKKKVPRSKPPFKLCFVLRQELGRSYLTATGPNEKAVAFITSKFYSHHESLNEEFASDLSAGQTYKEAPKEKFRQPVLESHRYGWYTEPLIEVDKSDRRLHFAKRTSDMVKVQCSINNKANN